MTEETEGIEGTMSNESEAAIEADNVATVDTFNIIYDAANPNPDKSGCIEVTARKDGKAARVFYDFGDDLNEMVEMLGENVVFTNARSKMKIGLQASLRAYLKAGQDIEKLMEKFKPGVALEKLPADMNKATESYFAGLSDEEQDAMIARLMERKGA